LEFRSETKILKSGSSVKIGVPELNDSQKLLDLKRSYIQKTSTILMVLNEYPNDVNSEA